MSYKTRKVQKGYPYSHHLTLCFLFMVIQLILYGSSVKKSYEIHKNRKIIEVLYVTIKDLEKQLASVQSVEYIKEYAKQHLQMVPLSLQQVKRIDEDVLCN
ncbi:hypothetical protein IPH25_03130 [bacterium]|nr:MAG: hypothetical protein IPG37_00120 [bacterium]QQR61460.1 MAG: hypothetical protein IPH25_03130 [bacterium]QQR63014.1 MAG: hypothetical protein IPH67_00880 [bacterium]